MAGAMLDEKWGYIDATGKYVIDPQFDEVDSLNGFRYGLTSVKLGEKWGFIDRAGRFVIAPRFDYSEFDLINGFRCGLIAVRIEGKWGYLDSTGSQFISPQFEDALAFTETDAPSISDDWI
jgi:hypothetical protein